jgi:Tfp pilus assembly protein PilO
MNPNQYILSLGEMSYAKVATWGLALCVVYFFTYFDDGASLVAQIAAANAELEKSQKNLAETKEAMADAERFEKVITQNKEQFKKVLEYLPSNMDANDLTRIISQQSQLTNSRVAKTEPSGLPEKKDFYEMIRLSFELQGTFSQVVAFLSAISKVQKLLTFEGIKIEMKEGADPENPSVRLSGVVVAYRYLQSEEGEGEVAAQ